jgi:hypothetical protein
MTATVRTRGHLVITIPSAGACRCATARDGRGARMTHYTDDPLCRNNPDRAPGQTP